MLDLYGMLEFKLIIAAEHGRYGRCQNVPFAFLGTDLDQTD